MKNNTVSRETLEKVMALEDLGRRIRYKRLQSGLSLRKVADATGVSVSTAYVWENGRRPSGICLYKLLELWPDLDKV